MENNHNSNEKIPRWLCCIVYCWFILNTLIFVSVFVYIFYIWDKEPIVPYRQKFEALIGIIFIVLISIALNSIGWYGIKRIYLNRGKIFREMLKYNFPKNNLKGKEQKAGDQNNPK